MGKYIASCLSVGALALFLAGSTAQAQNPEKGQATPAEMVKKSAKRTGIHWKIEPSTVKIFVDGKLVGVAGKTEFTKAKAGKHTVRLVNGEDEAEMDVQLKKGQVLRFRYAFEE